jgi:hypothetical protein
MLNSNPAFDEFGITNAVDRVGILNMYFVGVFAVAVNVVTYELDPVPSLKATEYVPDTFVLKINETVTGCPNKW